MTQDDTFPMTGSDVKVVTTSGREYVGTVRIYVDRDILPLRLSARRVRDLPIAQIDYWVFI